MEPHNKTLNQSNIIQDNKSKREHSADDSCSFLKENKTIKNDQEAKTESLEIIDEETKHYVDDMKKGTYNILVAVRCRPLSQKEKEINATETIKIMERKVIVLLDPANNNNCGLSKNRSRETTMAFDYAFDKSESQVDVFKDTTQFLIEGVVNGFNATVFAYGATGAGKTYTMLGNEDSPGIMPLTLSELFNRIKAYPDRDYTIKLWYLEIYNENIKDLLTNSDDYLDLREDPSKGVVVSNIKEITAASSDHVLSILRKGNRNRTTESTNANETSSRSHAILQVSVMYKEKNSGVDYEIKYGKLSLIDLAGSERASATLNKGIRLIEGANINRSLLTLGNCINALCEGNEKGTKPYIPYRDSKLTRLLKDSLGGNARTVMIANISPFANTFDDTYNTLNYANRAKKIKTTITRNVLNAQYHISNYVNIINNLKAEIFDLKTQLIHRRDMTASPKYKRDKDKEKDNSISNNNDITTIGVSKIQSSALSSSIPFDKIVDDIKNYCEAEIKLKQKTISEQIEMFNLISIIKRDQKQMVNEAEIDDNKAKLKQMKKIWEKKNDKLKEYQIAITNIIQLISKNTLSSFQCDYIDMIAKSHRSKSNVLDYKFKMLLLKHQLENKDDYIKTLENQIIIRDEILQRRNITYEDFNPNERRQYRTIHQLNGEFCSKSTIDSFQNDSSTNQLPPLSSNSNINAVLMDLKEMNINLNNKLKTIQDHSSSHNNIINKKTQSEVNINNITQQRGKKVIERHHSNNIRNIYSANSNYYTPLNQNQGPNRNQIPKININNNNGSNNQGNGNKNLKPISNQSGSSRIIRVREAKIRNNIVQQCALSEHNSLLDQEPSEDKRGEFHSYYFRDKITEENEVMQSETKMMHKDNSFPKITALNNSNSNHNISVLKPKDNPAYVVTQPNKRKKIPFKL